MVSRPCQKLNLYFYQFLLQTVLLMTIKVNFLNSSCILIGQHFGNNIIDLEGFLNRYQFDIIKQTIAIVGTLSRSDSILGRRPKNAERKEPQYSLNEKKDLDFIKLVILIQYPIYAEYIKRKTGSNASSLICSRIEERKTSFLHSCFVKPVIKRLVSIQKMDEAFKTRFQIVLVRLFLDIDVCLKQKSFIV